MKHSLRLLSTAILYVKMSAGVCPKCFAHGEDERGVVWELDSCRCETCGFALSEAEVLIGRVVGDAILADSVDAKERDEAQATETS